MRIGIEGRETLRARWRLSERILALRLQAHDGARDARAKLGSYRDLIAKANKQARGLANLPREEREREEQLLRQHVADLKTREAELQKQVERLEGEHETLNADLALVRPWVERAVQLLDHDDRLLVEELDLGVGDVAPPRMLGGGGR